MKINKQSWGMDFFKAALLYFWGAWFLFAFFTNLFDFLAAYHHLPPTWRFRSGNYALILNIIQIYQYSSPTGFILFFYDIFIQGWATVLFFVAAVKFVRGREYWVWINLAFIVSIGLWAVFILIDELFIAYSFESIHIRFFVFELLTFLAIHLLPDSSVK